MYKGVSNICQNSEFKDDVCDKFSLYMQEEEKRGQPNYEHLEEDLHVLISVEDTEERAKLRLAKAVEKAKDLLQPVVCWLGFVFSCH